MRISDWSSDVCSSDLALVSTLMEDGAPSVVQRTLIAPPRSRLGPVTAKERAIIQSASPLDGKYDQRVDRESANEVLEMKAADEIGRAVCWERVCQYV